MLPTNPPSIESIKRIQKEKYEACKLLISKYRLQMRARLNEYIKPQTFYNNEEMRRIWIRTCLDVLPMKDFEVLSKWYKFSECLTKDLAVVKYNNILNDNRLFSKITNKRMNKRFNRAKTVTQEDSELLKSLEQEPIEETHTDITEQELCGGTLLRLTLEVANDYLRTNPRREITTGEYLKAIERLAQLLAVLPQEDKPTVTYSNSEIEIKP